MAWGMPTPPARCARNTWPVAETKQESLVSLKSEDGEKMVRHYGRVERWVYGTGWAWVEPSWMLPEVQAQEWEDVVLHGRGLLERGKEVEEAHYCTGEVPL